MPTIPNKPTITRVLPTAGTHIARVIGFIYLGNLEEEYMGQNKMMQKIRLTFELPEDLHSFKEGEDAKPLVHSQEYTLTMGKKSNLRPIVEGIIGVALMDEEAYSFDAEKLVGMACLVNIKRDKTKKGADYAKIAGTSPLMKGQVCKEAYNPIKILTYEKWDQEYFDSLPPFIKEKMMTSIEYKQMKEIDPDLNIGNLPGETVDSSEDIPF